MLDTDLLRRKKAEIVSRYGAWTAHNIHIAGDVYTIGADARDEKLLRVVQVVADLAGRPFEDLRILDLACLEGQYGIELARHGAQVVGIEGREANLEKARFAQQALGLDNAVFYQDDVRNLSLEKYGAFDVVLCLGILYHLPPPDVFRFIHSIYEVCRAFAVFDTYVGVRGIQPFVWNDKTYWGRVVQEYPEDLPAKDRLDRRWASLDNPKSLWISRHSLYNLLLDAGFTSVYQCDGPVELNKPADRLTIVAIKGRRPQIISVPNMNDGWPARLPEDFRPRLSVTQDPRSQVSKRILNLFPASLRRWVKERLHGWGLMWKARAPGPSARKRRRRPVG